jgi:8-oxo-dGTP pyrophosphatase MutT (NUDIX family)
MVESESVQEWVDVVDLQDRVIGRASRRDIRSKNLLHRCIMVLCSRSDGAIYVHKRSDIKDVFPGLYDMFVGGVVVSAEAYEQCAVREIEEELGISGPAPTHILKHLYQGPKSRSWLDVYHVVWNGPIRHQESEVAWGAYCSLEKIQHHKDKDWAFVPDGNEVFELLMAQNFFSRLNLPT